MDYYLCSKQRKIEIQTLSLIGDLSPIVSLGMYVFKFIIFFCIIKLFKMSVLIAQPEISSGKVLKVFDCIGIKEEFKAVVFFFYFFFG